MEATGSFRLRGCMAALFSAVLSLLSSNPVFAVTAPVGTTPGSFAVNPNGGAHYSIPIVAPPGTSGLTPGISLNYDRQVKSELLGVGWSIGGLSLIQRCGAAIAIDGQKGGVNYDTNDKYCLDGQRLIAITGVYGADGTEYRTERETFQKIVSYGVQGNGPQSFKVWGKDGTVREYGITEDSRIEAQGKTTVRLWALNRVQDLRGSYLTVSYAEDNTNGEYRPTRIDYTGNTAVGLAPYNSIRFTYEPKPDIAPQYQGGSLIKTTQRLTKIESYADASLVREYRLGYDNNGTPAGVTYTPLTQTQFQGWTWATNARRVDDGSELFMADVNGDGKKDFIAVSPPGTANAGAVHVGLSDGTSFAGWTSISASRLDADSTTLFGDVNGDGKDDLIFITGPSGNVPGRVHIGLSNGTGFNFWTWNTSGRMVEDGSRLFLADVNGDGKKDLVAIPPPGSPAQYPGRIHVGLSNGTSFEQWTGVAGGIDIDAPMYIADVNGDGKEDFIAVATTGTNVNAVHVGLANGLSFNTWTSISATRLDTGSTVLLSDVNGDGKKDLVVVAPPGTPNAGAVHLGLSDGASFAAWTSISASRLDAGTIVQMGDVNADGKGDLIAISNPGGKVHIGLSSGTGFQFWSWDTGGRRVDDGSTNFVADVNGDGKADLTSITGSVGTYPGSVQIGHSILATIGQQESGTIGSSRLINVTECGTDGVCLPATTFQWRNGTVGSFSATASWSGLTEIGNNPAHQKFVDVNGDGRIDWVHVNGQGGLIVYLNNGQGGFSATPSFGNVGPNPNGLDSIGNDPTRQIFIDVNGDGFADLIHISGAGGGIVYLNNRQGGFNTSPNWSGLTNLGSDPSRQKFVDVNGDGLPDWLHISGAGGGIVYLNNGQGGFNASSSWSGFGEFGNDPYYQTFIDVNGDGRVDWIYHGADGGIVRLADGQGGFSSADAWRGLSQYGHETVYQNFIDVNGDGFPDWIYHGAGGGIVHLNNGRGEFNATSSWSGLTSLGSTSANQKFVDVNGDGLSDWVHISGSGGGIVYLNYKQGGFSAVASWSGLTYVGADATRQILVDVNGDGLPDWVHLSGSGGGIVHLAEGPMPDQLIGITNGLGAVTAITYKPLTDSTVYTKDSGAVYPYVDVQSPTYVVSRVTQSDGLGGSYGVGYQYAGAKVHLTGPGWLGYRMMKTTDERSGIVSSSYFNQTYDGTHSTPSYSETLVNGVVVKRQDHFWSPVSLGGGRAYGRLDGTLEQTFELNGAAVTCVSVNMTYDTFGNILTSVAKSDTSCSFTAPFTKTTTNTYNNDTAAWRLGQLLTAQVTSEAPNTLPLTRSSAFTYAANGLIESETVEPNTSLSLTSSYAYDSFGNRTGTTVSGPDITTRTSSATYDTRGRYAVSAANALGHSATTTYDALLGLPVSVTDANSLTATVTYDGLGRKLSETKPDGSVTTFDYAACDASCPANAVFRLTTTPTGGGAVTSYHDLLSRVLRKQSYGFSGQLVYQDTEYDTLGRVARASHPYFVGETVHWDARTYDALGRVTALTEADGGIVQTAYAGLTTTTTNPLGQTGVSLKNAAGQLVRSTDALGNYSAYEYDALGNLTKVTDAAGNMTTMTYDLRGRKVAMNDPDMGSWSYSYNALGELISQTDAKGQVVSMGYDVLGRMVNRTNPEGIGTWTYDSAAKGIGKLATVSSPGFQESYSYDTLGRANQVTTVINGETFVTATAYDAISRVDTVTYPTGFATKNIYNPQGFLTELKNAANNASFWQASAADAHSRLTQETYGNGLLSEHIYNHADGSLVAIRTTGPLGIAQDLSYTFDLVGNLKSRTDSVQLFTETFTYDQINRLTGVAGPSPKSYTYDAIGNITSKSDVGTYLYGQGGAKPHAVTQAGPNTYTYDANGNQISGAGRTITYTSFNKPSQITTATASVSFAYDANQRRVTKTTASSTTVYLGKLYEKVTASGATDHKHYLYAANTLVGIYTQKPDGTTQTRYVHTDHLLSVDTITDEAGNVVSRLSYDAHGKRRNANGTDATSPISTSVTRGFTRHEMDDEIGLINMNAREYDPVLGRFLTPDTFVQYPANTQGFNRYSYVHNNPLSYTDPSGYFLGSIIREISRAVKDVVNEVKRAASSELGRIAIAAWTAWNVGAWISNYAEGSYLMSLPADGIEISAAEYASAKAAGVVAGGAASGATYGATSTALNGGNLRDTLNSGLRGGVTGGLSGFAGTTYGSVYKNGSINWREGAYQVGAKATLSGVASEMNGGSFGDGFRRGAVMGSLSVTAEGMRAAMVEQSANNSGLSAWGVKLAGCRQGSSGWCFGGLQQNGKGYLFAYVDKSGDITSKIMPYQKGDFIDHVLEAFAGPHDALNSPHYYDKNGNGGSGSQSEFWNVINVGIATPFAATGAASHYLGSSDVFLYSGRY